MYPRLPHPGPAPALPVGAETAWLGMPRRSKRGSCVPPRPWHRFRWSSSRTATASSSTTGWRRRAPHRGWARCAPGGVTRATAGPEAGTQESITDTMVAAFDFLLQQPDVDGARIVAYGRSLGGGAACALGAVRPVAALVLESTFTSVAAAGPWYLPRALVLDPFDNLAVAASRVAPTLVLHGTRSGDPLWPWRGACPRAGHRSFACRGGHNDCPRPWTAVLRFLEEQGIVS